ncbi:MAG TPA: DUF2865 domain-containing protein [Bradyrhizobium sp.]|uniref:DUF2865 domain-containing protein n=1 Tax=Bradyrhizobium sp. TaxID=376 RepID=UPI002C577EA4|nr:DUF2865 domain-containing protein [Bradyrhizobium sp.]HLZ05709.1 DUF2865 domain-containing protein [Bradyrhizobium sp.]
MRKSVSFPRGRRRAVLVAAIAIGSAIALAPYPVSAEGLFDFFFGSFQKQQQREAPPQASFFADPYANNNPQPAPVPRAAVASSGPAFCVRSCDGKYFPLIRGDASPAQTCQSFCPASPTKVFYGSNIDSATSANGERYADSENAFAYRKALRADCTCNGRDPAGLAPVDLTLDTSLRPGDVVATTSGLVAFSGVRIGNDQTAEFTPVASYPGLTADVRARLGELKVAPVSAEIATSDVPASLINPGVAPVATPAPKPAPLRDKRAEVD